MYNTKIEEYHIQHRNFDVEKTAPKEKYQNLDVKK